MKTQCPQYKPPQSERVVENVEVAETEILKDIESGVRWRYGKGRDKEKQI